MPTEPLRQSPPLTEGAPASAAVDSGPEALELALDVAPRAPAPEWLAYGEALLLAALALLLGSLLDRADPFTLRRGFPWVLLAPVLAGLRYGSAKALACAALLDGAAVLAWWARFPMPEGAREAVAGWTVVGLVAGEFADGWRRRARALEAAITARRRQAEGLWRAHLALEASYERARQLAPSDTPSLSEALDELAAALARATALGTAAEALSEHGPRVLALLAQHAYVQVATLHAVGDEGRPAPAIARLGDTGAHEGDRMVLAAAASRVVESARTRGSGSALLAAVPLVDVDRRLHGVVAVREMPFLSLHEDTLRVLAVIGGRLGESLRKPQPVPAPAPVPAASRLAAANALLSRPVLAPEPAHAPRRAPARSMH